MTRVASYTIQVPCLQICSFIGTSLDYIRNYIRNWWCTKYTAFHNVCGCGIQTYVFNNEKSFCVIRCF